MAKRRTMNNGIPENSPDTPEWMKLNHGRWIDGVWHWDPKHLKHLDKLIQDYETKQGHYAPGPSDTASPTDNTKGPLLKTPEY